MGVPPIIHFRYRRYSTKPNPFFLLNWLEINVGSMLVQCWITQNHQCLLPKPWLNQHFCLLNHHFFDLVSLFGIAKKTNIPPYGMPCPTKALNQQFWFDQHFSSHFEIAIGDDHVAACRAVSFRTSGTTERKFCCCKTWRRSQDGKILTVWDYLIYGKSMLNGIDIYQMVFIMFTMKIHKTYIYIYIYIYVYYLYLPYLLYLD